MCSIWHLAAVSVVKCTVIVRPLTHFTIFTDRVLRAIICTIWTLSLVIGGTTNVGVTEAHFNWTEMMTDVKRRNTVFLDIFNLVTFIVATLIVMTAYTKVFLVVRRKVRSVPSGVLGSFGSRTIFSSSLRSAKNLFVICIAHWSTYMPVMLRVVLGAQGVILPALVQFAVLWIYMSSPAVNGFLYILLHSSVRRELQRYLPICRRSAVVPATTHPVGNGEHQRHIGTGVPGGVPGAPVSVMTSSCQRVSERLPTTVL